MLLYSKVENSSILLQSILKLYQNNRAEAAVKLLQENGSTTYFTPNKKIDQHKLHDLKPMMHIQALILEHHIFVCKISQIINKMM